MLKTFIPIAALAAALTAAPALATDPAAPSATVRLGDLDLSRPGVDRQLQPRLAALRPQGRMAAR